MQEGITYEDPEHYTPENIIYWEPTSKELRQAGRFGIALLNKARKFLQNHCIEQLNFSTWICKPIKDYNKTPHYIRSIPNPFPEGQEGLGCDCQGFKKKKKLLDEGISNEIPICSHIIAVKQYCFIESKNK